MTQKGARSLVLAFDPGATTGYVLVDVDPPLYLDVLDAGEIPWDTRFEDLARLLPPRLYAPDVRVSEPVLLPDYVVVESFQLYPHKAKSQIGSRFPSAQMIGSIETFVALCPASPTLVFQTAASKARVQIPDEAAPLLRGNHMKDAFRHARYFAVMKLGLRDTQQPSTTNPTQTQD